MNTRGLDAIVRMYNNALDALGFTNNNRSRAEAIIRMAGIHKRDMRVTFRQAAKMAAQQMSQITVADMLAGTCNRKFK